MTNEHHPTHDIPLQTMPTRGDINITSDRTMSLAEAAEHLGVSERTVLRRIRKGQLQAHKADTPYGPAWQVTLDTSPDRAPPTAPGTPDTMPSTGDTPVTSPEFMKMLEIVEEDRRLIDRLQRDNQQLAGQVGYLQRQVLEQQETIQRLLAAPREEPEPTDVTPQEAPTQADTGPDWQAIAQALEERVKRLEEPPVEPAPPAEPARVSWWKRLFS